MAKKDSKEQSQNIRQALKQANERLKTADRQIREEKNKIASLKEKLDTIEKEFKKKEKEYNEARINTGEKDEKIEAELDRMRRQIEEAEHEIAKRQERLNDVITSRNEYKEKYQILKGQKTDLFHKLLAAIQALFDKIVDAITTPSAARAYAKLSDEERKTVNQTQRLNREKEDINDTRETAKTTIIKENIHADPGKKVRDFENLSKLDQDIVIFKKLAKLALDSGEHVYDGLGTRHVIGFEHNMIDKKNGYLFIKIYEPAKDENGNPTLKPLKSMRNIEFENGIISKLMIQNGKLTQWSSFDKHLLENILELERGEMEASMDPNEHTLHLLDPSIANEVDAAIDNYIRTRNEQIDEELARLLGKQMQDSEVKFPDAEENNRESEDAKGTKEKEDQEKDQENQKDNQNNKDNKTKESQPEKDTKSTQPNSTKQWHTRHDAERVGPDEIKNDPSKQEELKKAIMKLHDEYSMDKNGNKHHHEIDFYGYKLEISPAKGGNSPAYRIDGRAIGEYMNKQNDINELTAKVINNRKYLDNSFTAYIVDKEKQLEYYAFEVDARRNSKNDKELYAAKAIVFDVVHGTTGFYDRLTDSSQADKFQKWENRDAEIAQSVKNILEKEYAHDENKMKLFAEQFNDYLKELPAGISENMKSTIEEVSKVTIDTYRSTMKDSIIFVEDVSQLENMTINKFNDDYYVGKGADKKEIIIENQSNPNSIPFMEVLTEQDVQNANLDIHVINNAENPEIPPQDEEIIHYDEPTMDPVGHDMNDFFNKREDMADRDMEYDEH